MSDDFEGDPESIAYMGSVAPKPEVPIDFDRPIWEVDFYFKHTMYPVVVNATDEKDAIVKANDKAKGHGLMPITAERLEVFQLISMDGGSEDNGSELEDSGS